MVVPSAVMTWYRFRMTTLSADCQRQRHLIVLLAFVSGFIFLYPFCPSDSGPDLTLETGEIKVENVYGIDSSNREGWDNNTIGCSNIDGWVQDDSKLVECLKKSFLIPPSTKPYNLDKPKIRNPSQFQQNIFVHKLLGNKLNGFFVECGAFDGERFSNTLMLERFFGWTGLLIEPQIIPYKRLESKNRKAWSSNTCLSIKPFTQKLPIVGVGGNDVQAHVPRKNETNTGAIVQCFPLFTYILALNQTVIDYFSLDVESSDFAVLQTIPFDKVIFKVLEVEVAGMKKGRFKVKKFMESNGYKMVKYIEPDFIFTHNSLQAQSVPK